MFSVLLLLSSSLFAFSLSLFLSTFSLTGHDLAVREVAREEVVVGGHVLFFFSGFSFFFFFFFQARFVFYSAPPSTLFKRKTFLLFLTLYPTAYFCGTSSTTRSTSRKGKLRREGRKKKWGGK